MNPIIDSFYDPATWTVTHLVYDHPGGVAAIIDPVLDFDPRSGRTRSDSAQQVLAAARALDLHVAWVLETHAHADHLSAAAWLKAQLGCSVGIGERIREVQHTFAGLFNLGDAAPRDGAPFDRLFADGEIFALGQLSVEVLAVPGHTPADVAYRIGDHVFVGDTLFMPDVGTARCDFPGGDAHQLYRSIRRLLALPESTQLMLCHDYPPAGRTEPAWMCTVAAQRAGNIHVHDGVDEATFVERRQARDRTLDMPTLLLPSVQVNIRAGQLPPAEANGVSYLKLPVNAL